MDQNIIHRGLLRFADHEARREGLFTGQYLSREVSILRVRSSNYVNTIEQKFSRLNHKNLSQVVYKFDCDDNNTYFAFDKSSCTLSVFLDDLLASRTENNEIKNYQLFLTVIKQLFTLVVFLHENGLVCHGLPEDCFMLDETSLDIKFCPLLKFARDDGDNGSVANETNARYVDFKSIDMILSKIVFTEKNSPDDKTEHREFENDHFINSRLQICEFVRDIRDYKIFPRLNIFVKWSDKKIINFICDVCELRKDQKRYLFEKYVGSHGSCWKHKVNTQLKRDLRYNSKTKTIGDKDTYMDTLDDFARFFRDVYFHFKGLTPEARTYLVTRDNIPIYIFSFHRETFMMIYTKMSQPEYKNKFEMTDYFNVE